MPQFTPSIKSKLPQIGTTIFTVMSALASEYGAINLGQGFPDFACHPDLLKYTEEAMRKGYNQYAPMPGLLSLREQIAIKAEELYGAKYNPDTEITVTAGGTEAIYAAITAAINEGDEVIIFEPAYDCYAPAIELCKGIPVYVRLEAPDYTIPWEAVKKLINPRTRMIMINTPHNPTGTVLNKEDLLQLEKLTKGTDIIVLSDEVYEHIIFDDTKHQSVLLYPGLAERSFVVYSFGKTYHNTGWKTGYCLAPAELMKEFRKVHQYIVFSVNTPLQHTFAEIMKRKDLYLGLKDFYQEKRDYFLSLLKGSKFKWQKAAGSYFQLLDYSEISNEKDADYAIRLTKESGVASVPLSAFYHSAYDQKQLRFCFAKENTTLEKAAEQLMKI